MTISLDDPLFRHYLEERPTLTYAQPLGGMLSLPCGRANLICAKNSLACR